MDTKAKYDPCKNYLLKKLLFNRFGRYLRLRDFIFRNSKY